MSALEHHSILEPVEALRTQGFQITYQMVDSTGLVNPEDIRGVITDKTILIAVIHASNEIGTIQPIAEIGAIAKENNIPFYIAAPLSTFDLSIKSGNEIPIEERDEKEVTHINEKSICADGTKVRNPAFDITPNKYITGIITEKGVLTGKLEEAIYKAFNTPVIV